LDGGDLTSGAAELVSMAGATESFARAADVVLPRMSGLTLAESTVERTSEAVGVEAGQAIEAKVAFDETRLWDWHKDADGMTCAYVSIDLTGVRKQGAKGAAAEGEMIAVGMVYNPVPESRTQWADPQARRRPSWQTRYVTSLEGQEAVAEPLRHMAARVGMSQAKRWIAVCDGGVGLEDLLRQHFGRIDEVILDFSHASEHLGDFAKAWYADADEAKAAHAQWSHRLKHEGAAAVLAWLESLDVASHPRARASWEEVVTYFRNQHHRMDYPAYLAKGWQIGSGPVEAACKLVINERMNGPGMRWSHEGADAIGHLCALLLSEPALWKSFWANRRKSA
jgi:hypothetical protein